MVVVVVVCVRARTLIRQLAVLQILSFAGFETPHDPSHQNPAEMALQYLTTPILITVYSMVCTVVYQYFFHTPHHFFL